MKLNDATLNSTKTNKTEDNKKHLDNMSFEINNMGEN